MRRRDRRNRALKLEREIDQRLAALSKVPRVRLLKERAVIVRLRAEAARLAA